VVLADLKFDVMMNINTFSIDDETISKIGLQLSNKQINALIAPDSRIFDYPNLDNVFIMESDFYGNKVPQNSCFVAFYGNAGLIGKHLKVEFLRNATIEEMKNIVLTVTED
jgi:predicted nucleotidyltransferase